MCLHNIWIVPRCCKTFHDRYLVSWNTRKKSFNTWHSYSYSFKKRILKMCKKLKSQDGFLKADQNMAKKNAASLDKLASSSELSWDFTFLHTFAKVWKINPGVKRHPKVIGASNATWRYWGVKFHPGLLTWKWHHGVIGESKATQGSKGRHQGSWGLNGASNIMGQGMKV